MIIELPSQYERIEGKNDFARVREGVLELKGNYDFEKINPTLERWVLDEKTKGKWYDDYLEKMKKNQK